MDRTIDTLNISKLIDLKELVKHDPSAVRVRGFVRNMRLGRSVSFIELRDGAVSIQVIYSDNQNESLNKIAGFSLESFIEITGEAVPTKWPVKSCSIKNIEIIVSSMKILSNPIGRLPIDLNQNTSFSSSKISISKCLDNRVLDLRSSHTSSIFRVIDSVMFHFRGFLREKGFLEIKTPKIIQTATEGGANLFQVSYFDKKAFLGQSPQLYKQMCVIGGFKRVYEIGHVYRAEESNINRYLSEFIGLDFEMEIENCFMEIVEKTHSLLVYIFDKINEEMKEELANIRGFRPFIDLKYKKSPVVYSFAEICGLLGQPDLKDLNRENERKAGLLIKERDGVDIFVIRSYPTQSRPFYTRKDRNNPEITNSFDFIIRGEEVLSGAERISNYSDLVESIKKNGISPDSLEDYLNAFKLGVPPHGGSGLGLERLVKSFLGFNDIRYFSIFPRDPSRLNP